MRDIIVGPSHVVRLEHLYNNNIIKNSLKNVVFICRGGAPTWSFQLFKSFEECLKHDDATHLIIGDFRFGNTIIEDAADIYETEINHINVTGRLINDVNDLTMVGHFTDGLFKWKHYGVNVNFIPWTLIMRRADNISKRKHVNENGSYNHPQMDEVELIREFCNPGYVKCLDIPVEIISQFYIDGDLHPSTLGYMFILDMLKKNDPYRSLNSSIVKLSLVLDKYFKRLKLNKKVLITGDSISLPTLSKVIPFNKDGFENIRAYSHDDFTCKFSDLKNEVFIIELLSLDSTLKYSIYANDCTTVRFPWDYLGYSTISRRHIDLQRLKPSEMSLEGISEESVKDSFFDIGERLTPTIKGVLFIISLASSLNIKKKNEILEDTLIDIFGAKSNKEHNKTHLLVLLKNMLSKIYSA